MYGKMECWLLSEYSVLTHFLYFGGKSSSNKHAAFRECFRLNVNVSCIVSRVYYDHSIQLHLLFFTATTTEGTKQEMFDVY